MLVKDIIGEGSVWMPGKGYEDEKPIFSVLLPTYSRAQNGYLQKYVNSVLKQTLQELELIIVVDGSTDGTLDICKRYMEYDPRVSVIWHEHNIGLPAISTYEAYIKARGDYIAYGFDDNVWELDALEKTYHFMEEKHVQASFGIVTVTDPVTKTKVEYGREITGSTPTMELLWTGNRIGAGAVVLRRQVLETVGLHDPHLALTRICDWDLWLRVIERFPFVATNIPFAAEYGTLLPDSLGNSFLRDAWFQHERMQHRDVESLKVERYCDVDVTEWPDGCSQHFLQCLHQHYMQYQGRNWFSTLENEAILRCAPNKQHRYVLMLCADRNASMMNFIRADSRDTTFFYIPFDAISMDILVRADISVCCRLLTRGQRLLPLFNNMDIPCYYFTDDNFREIAKEVNDPHIQMESDLTSTNSLATYTGVIVTTEALRSYFLERHLHDNVILLGPVTLKHELPWPSKSRPFTVGFMGGPFREEVLKECVLPALKALAKSQHVRLVCPCTPETQEMTLRLSGNGLEILPVFRTNNYERLLNSYAQIGIDLLVHCGEGISNNVYKTKNALINAVSLHAPLLVSDIRPYNDFTDGSQESYQIVPNLPEAWDDAIRQLANNPLKRKALYEKGAALCRLRYAAPVVWEELAAVFADQPWHDTFYCYKRYEKLRLIEGATTLTPAGAMIVARRFDPSFLRFSGELRRRTYGFTSQTEQIRTVGLLFGVIGSCEGDVKLTFRRGRDKPFALLSIPIRNLAENDYTLIPMPSPVEVRLGERLYVEIEVKYSKKGGHVGVFEDRRYRTFGYKLFNKLKFPIPGRNALFVDCRG